MKKKNENFYAKKLRESEEYRQWWSGLLESDAYKQARIFVEHDFDKERSVNNGWAYFREVSKDEFELRYREGRINDGLIVLHDSFKDISIIKKLGVTSFFDPTPGAIGLISHFTAGCAFSSDGNHDTPRINPSASAKEKNNGMKATDAFFRKTLNIETPEDENPSAVALRKRRNDPGKNAIDNLRKRIKRVKQDDISRTLTAILRYGTDNESIEVSEDNGSFFVAVALNAGDFDSDGRKWSDIYDLLKEAVTITFPP
jgi:hypothetical protein